MIDKVSKLIRALGYNLKDTDTILIDLELESAKGYILDFCNIVDIPNTLTSVLIELTAYRFLKEREALQFEVETEDGQLPVKSITQGDISVSYDVGVDKAKNKLKEIDKKIRLLQQRLISYRRIKW